MKTRAFVSTLIFLGSILLSSYLPGAVKQAEAFNPGSCVVAHTAWQTVSPAGNPLVEASLSCMSSGGFCAKLPALFPGAPNFGAYCNGSECQDCCAPTYDCTGLMIAVPSVYSCCKKIEAPPTDTCSMIPAPPGGDVLNADCKTGKVCPDSGTGACIACSSGTGGICFKSADGTQFVNNCCAGYMCPESVSGLVPCVPGNEQVRKLLTTVTGILLPLAVILGMGLIVRNGYRLMTSQGDPTKLQEGKEGLTSAIIGLIFILMAVSILRVIIKALITGDTDPFS